MANNYQFITETGVIVPDTATTRAQVEAEFRAVFGDDLAVEPSTPAGVLITRITEERDAIARNNAALANQINPDIAGGVFLDAIWRLTGGQRNASVKSLLTGVTLAGVPGTVVPAGSLAIAATGERFELVDAQQLDLAGTTTGTFRALDFGAITVPPHGLNTIASSVLGWESVDNSTAAVVGRDQESDAQSRRRRRQTLALQSSGTLEAITSRLYDLPEVRSLNALENAADTTQVIDGITLAPHSVWACVEGGSDLAVATALFDSVSAGAGYNGGVTVNITEPISGQAYPVKFDRPVDVPILIKVTARAMAIDLATIIPQLVMNYVNGLIAGDLSFIVGADVSPWEVSGAINQQNPMISVLKVELTTVAAASFNSNVLAIAANEIARITLGNIQVVTV